MNMTKKENNEPTGEIRLRVRIRENIAAQRKKQGTSWKHDGGSLCRFFTILCYAGAIVSLIPLVINLCVLAFGIPLQRSALQNKQLDDPAAKLRFLYGNAWVVAILFALAVAAFVFLRLRKRHAACLTGFVFGLLLVWQFVQVYTGLYENKNLLAAFYYPALMLPVGAIGLYIIIQNDRRVENKVVQKEMNKLYALHSKEGDLITVEEWDRCIADYELRMQEAKNEYIQAHTDSTVHRRKRPYDS